MSNQVYQTAVEELEALLSPRVVSRSLKEGLSQVGRSPETADLEALERILKDHVYRQLQVTMPVTEAKNAIARIVEKLRELSVSLGGDAGGRSGSQAASRGLSAQQERLDKLTSALKPFNLYFEWPEVQKLRAQVQLLENEHKSGREAYALSMDAEAQLELVMQKHEDQLVLQAKELADLRESFEQVRSLGGPKIRRLEAYVQQVTAAQEGRQLAPAEIERARRLARDLRKLLESSVYAEQAEAAADRAALEQTPAEPASSHPPSPYAIDAQVQTSGTESVPLEADALLGASDLESLPVASVETGSPSGSHDQLDQELDDLLEGMLDVDSEEEELLSIDTSKLDPEVNQRLQLIDLDGELHDLAALESEFSELFKYRPGLAARIVELRGEVEQRRSVAEFVGGLREVLETSSAALRSDLREELEEIEGVISKLRPEVEISELTQAVRVTLGILSSSLPSLADVDHVRQLRRLAEEADVAQERAEAALAEQLKDQEDLLARLENTLVRYEDGESAADEVDRLRTELMTLREANTKRTIMPEVVASALQAEERIARLLAERATEASERRRARLEALRAQVEGLPVTETHTDRLAGVRVEIDRLISEQISAEAASALLLDDPSGSFGPEIGTAAAEDDINAVQGVVDSLKRDLADSVQHRVQELAAAAAEFGATRLIERLHMAAEDLIERGRFPDLKLLNAALQQEREAHRLDQVSELHRLTRAFAPFSGGTGVSEQVAGMLAESKQQLDRGVHAPRLQEAATLVAQLESALSTRLDEVPTRLDAALTRFETVAPLNSEDVASARRILMHLDSQREALGRVSTGLKLQLEASLTQAEQLLDRLEEEFEATRAIADQLVTEGLLDGVFGFGAKSESEDKVAPRSAADEWLAELQQRYEQQEGVTAAAVRSLTSEASFGEPPLEWERVEAFIEAATALQDPVGEESDASWRIASVEAGGGATIIGSGTDIQVVLTLGSPALLTVVANRLRRDLNDRSHATSQDKLADRVHEAG